jgi:hypothetical protein
MSKIVDRLKEIEKDLTAKKLAEEALKVFKEETPIRSGNARRNTFLRGDEIQANYPYARRLDEGYSKQSPDGMTQPTIDHIQKYINNYSKG